MNDRIGGASGHPADLLCQPMTIDWGGWITDYCSWEKKSLRSGRSAVSLMTDRPIRYEDDRRAKVNFRCGIWALLECTSVR